MNTLIFWLGFFAGNTFFAIAILVWTNSVRRKQSDEHKAYNDEVLQLMKDRNASEVRVANVLERMELK